MDYSDNQTEFQSNCCFIELKISALIILKIIVFMIKFVAVKKEIQNIKEILND